MSNARECSESVFTKKEGGGVGSSPMASHILLAASDQYEREEKEKDIRSRPNGQEAIMQGGERNVDTKDSHFFYLQHRRWK